MKSLRSAIVECVLVAFIGAGFFHEIAVRLGYGHAEHFPVIGAILGTAIAYIVTSGALKTLWQMVVTRLTSIPLYWKALLCMFGACEVVGMAGILYIAIFLRFYRGEWMSASFVLSLLGIVTTLTAYLTWMLLGGLKDGVVEDREKYLQNSVEFGRLVMFLANPIGTMFFLYMTIINYLPDIWHKAWRYVLAERSRFFLISTGIGSSVGFFFGSAIIGAVMGALFAGGLILLFKFIPVRSE